MRVIALAAALCFAIVEGFAPNRRTGQSFFSSRRRTQEISLSAGSNAAEPVPLKQGSTCALITPMTPTGALDIDGLRTILRYHVASGTDGLCILGTTGEASTLSMDEREVVLKTAVEEVKGKIPIMAGTGTINPEHVKEQTLQAMDLGCDASLVVTPYYVKPPARALVKHFISMADLGLPVVIYNVPGRSGIDFKPESIALCADHENIVAVKEATGDVSRVEEIRGLVGDKLLLYSGDDGTTTDFVLRGGNGCISVTANVAAAEMHELMMAALKKDQNEVDRINGPLKMLHQNLFVEANPIPAKWAVKRIGKIQSAYCRPPLDELAPEYYPQVEEALMAAKLVLEAHTV